MKKETKKRLFDVMTRIDETFRPNLNEDENDGAFNAAGEPRMTHQQFRDYSEPAEPDNDMDRDMPVPPPKGIGDFRDIDWKVLHGIFVQNREALQSGSLTSAVNVGDLTDYDGYLSQEEMDLIDAAGLIYNDGVFPLIDDDKYLDYQTFYNKAQEVWQNPEKYMIRSYTRGGDDSEAPYMRGYEPMDEIFGLSQKEKDTKALQQKVEQAKQEVEKSRPGATVFGQPATEGKWSERKYHDELMRVRLNLIKQDLPTVMELLPDLFDDNQGYANAMYEMGGGQKIQGYVLSNWYPIVVEKDGLVRIDSGKEKLTQMLDQLAGNLNEGKELFPIGSKVKVSDGSGLASNKTGTVVPPNEVKVDGTGVPINVQGAYKPVDWSREVAVQLDDGELITMFKNRLTQIG